MRQEIEKSLLTLEEFSFVAISCSYPFLTLCLDKYRPALDCYVTRNLIN